MNDWQQIALGLFVGMLAWNLACRLAEAAFTVFARRSPTLARWVADSERKNAAFRARVRRS